MVNSSDKSSEVRDISRPAEGFFEGLCRRQGRDPVIERGKMAARSVVHRSNWESTFGTNVESPGITKKEISLLVDALDRTHKERTDNFLASITSKDELKNLVLDLLFDSIVEIATGVMEGLQREPVEPEGTSETSSEGVELVRDSAEAPQEAEEQAERSAAAGDQSEG